MKSVCGTSNAILPGSASETALVKTLVSLQPSVVNYENFIGNYTTFFRFSADLSILVEFLYFAGKFLKLRDDFNVDDGIWTCFGGK